MFLKKVMGKILKFAKFDFYSMFSAYNVFGYPSSIFEKKIFGGHIGFFGK